MTAIEKALRKLANPERAKNNAWFFKTGKGQYGYGDQFLGVRLPQIRQSIQSNFKTASVKDAVSLLKSPLHEVRLAGCILMVMMSRRARKLQDAVVLKQVYTAYMQNLGSINNWDLVDVSAGEIVGNNFLGKNPQTIIRMAKSPSLWKRRIAVIASSAFINSGDASLTFTLCKMLLDDPHDLMHKACGWMLREVGKRCGMGVLDSFLDKHAGKMPRTMLRYALEKHPGAKRTAYMRREV